MSIHQRRTCESFTTPPGPLRQDEDRTAGPLEKPTPLPTALRPTSRKEREKWGTRFAFVTIMPTRQLIFSAEMWATRPGTVI
jgi:hypothetical protein